MGKLRLSVIGMCLLAAGTSVAAQDRYLLLATSRTGTMQDELNEAGAGGYRFAATQGGETAFGGREAVVVMERDPEGRTYRYILLATSRTDTMQDELNGVPPEFALVRHGLEVRRRRQSSRLRVRRRRPTGVGGSPSASAPGQLRSTPGGCFAGMNRSR